MFRDRREVNAGIASVRILTARSRQMWRWGTAVGADGWVSSAFAVPRTRSTMPVTTTRRGAGMWLERRMSRNPTIWEGFDPLNVRCVLRHGDLSKPEYPV